MWASSKAIADNISLLPVCVDDYVAPDALVRVVDAFVDSLDLAELGFNRAVAARCDHHGLWGAHTFGALKRCG